MRILCHVLFRAYNNELSQIRELTERNIKQLMPGKEPQLYAIEIYKDSLEYMPVFELISQIYPKRIITEVREYSEKELYDAELLHIMPKAHRGGYPQPESGSVQERYMGISYNTQVACPNCSIGMKQVKPLRLRGSTKLGKNDISGIFWLKEFVVNQRLKNLIIESGLTGCEFWPVISHGKNVEFEDIMQLKIKNTMPPMDASAPIWFTREWKNARSCPNGCGERKMKGPICYKRDDLHQSCDFMLTNEWFGSYLDYWQLPLISKKTYHLFKENKIKGLLYEPVKIID